MSLKRTSLKRRRGKAKPRLSQGSAREAYSRFNAYGTHHQGFVSCICGCGLPAQEWHHIFDQNAYPELADEPDNVVPVGFRCHAEHTNAKRRLPRSVCRYAEGLALTPQMERYLEREYPASTAEA